MTITVIETTVTATINADVFAYAEDTGILTKNGKRIALHSSERLEFSLRTNGMRRVYAAAFVAAIAANAE